MGEGSAIEWTDHTFNPWVGCEKVSPGCAHCYAEVLVTGRMNRPGTWGADGIRQRTSASTWALPRRWERQAERFAAEHGRRQRVFVASLADVFEPRPELEPWRTELFEMIDECRSLDWLVLTKRPEEARTFWADWHDYTPIVGRVLPNVWLGTSIENSRHTWRADVLREIPAAVRFISAEPLLGSLYPPPIGHAGAEPEFVDGALLRKRPLDLSGIDWIIVGGESGGRTARPMHPDWAREIRDACLGCPVERWDGPYRFRCSHGGEGDACSIHGKFSRPAFFFKQWGSFAPPLLGRRDATHLVHEDGRVVSIADATRVRGAGQTGPGMTEDLVDRGHPGWARVRYVGRSPKAGGAFLDGANWREWPVSSVPTPGQLALG